MSRISRTIVALVILHVIAAVCSEEAEKRGMGFHGVRGKKFYDVPEFFKRKPQFFVGVKGKKSVYDLFESPELYFKRAPMGFMGMRGKKDLRFYDEMQTPTRFEDIMHGDNELYLDEAKRAPMGFVGMRGKKEMYLDEDKRSPMGFVGMRGKKEQYLDEDKRSPMGFLGMRGKKELYLDEENRGPMGFVGMQGKKDWFVDEEKRALGFVGMRGKKELLDEDKRGPMGFVGMRGKKDWYFDEEKRAPMGFVGMRGMKDSTDVTNYPDGFDNMPKRGSLIGQIDYDAIDENHNEFLLLKDILHNLEHPDSAETATEAKEPMESITNEIGKRNANINEIEKRAANMNEFFGFVRGKKEDKRPYDLSFRGKFIGVRGKKNNPAEEVKIMLNQGSLPKRKGSMGFIGMRGKKWNDDSSPETVSPN